MSMAGPLLGLAPQGLVLGMNVVRSGDALDKPDDLAGEVRETVWG
jgi:hypothetical protein